MGSALNVFGRVVSTLFGVVTIPVVIGVGQVIWSNSRRTALAR